MGYCVFQNNGRWYWPLPAENHLVTSEEIIAR